jgi:hypothetical protein
MSEHPGTLHDYAGNAGWQASGGLERLTLATRRIRDLPQQWTASPRSLPCSRLRLACEVHVPKKNGPFDAEFDSPELLTESRGTRRPAFDVRARRLRDVKILG